MGGKQLIFLSHIDVCLSLSLCLSLKSINVSSVEDGREEGRTEGRKEGRKDVCPSFLPCSFIHAFINVCIYVFHKRLLSTSYFSKPVLCAEETKMNKREFRRRSSERMRL